MRADISFRHTGLPDCTVPILSHLPGVDESLGMHGTGFLVRRNRSVFLVTARHCLGRLQDDLSEVASNLLIPHRRLDRGRGRHNELLNFDLLLTGKSLEDPDAFVGNGDLDIAVLRIRPRSVRVHRELLSRSIKLPPDGDWFERSWATASDLRASSPMWVRTVGYPKSGTDSRIDYDRSSVVVQGVKLLAKVVDVGPYPHSMTMQFEQGGPITDADGMSGGPVFLRLRQPSKINQYDYFLAGMTINGTFPVAHFVTVRWFTDIVNRSI